MISEAPIPTMTPTITNMQIILFSLNIIAAYQTFREQVISQGIQNTEV